MYFRYGDPDWETSDTAEAAGRSAAPQPADTRTPSGNGQANGNGHQPNGNGSRRKSRSRVLDMPTVDLRGVHINAITETQAVSHIMTELGAGRGGMVVTPNLDHLHRCLHDIGFAALVSEAEMIVADGMGGKGTNGAYANQIRALWEARAAGTPRGAARLRPWKGT